MRNQTIPETAMEAKHTPGPWKVCVVGDGDDGKTTQIIAADGSLVLAGWGYDASGLRWGQESAREDNARDIAALPDARLIVAAPDLLDALKALRIDANRLCDRQLGGSYEADCRRAIKFADLAIDKAEGRAIPTRESAMSCGCDPGEAYTCEQHRGTEVTR